MIYKLINPINPFGQGCAAITECDDATKEWLIATEKTTEDNFEIVETIEKNKKK